MAMTSSRRFRVVSTSGNANRERSRSARRFGHLLARLLDVILTISFFFGIASISAIASLNDLTPSAVPENSGAARTGRDDGSQVASRSSTLSPSTVAKSAAGVGLPVDNAGAPVGEPVAMAKQAIADCQRKFAAIDDYSCTFLKRERVGGRLTSLHVMSLKARTKPTSLYLKFQKPNKGREAIYVEGRNGGRMLAHDVGIGRFLAGTMHLDPRGSMAMENSRHPITEAGIGSLIETVARHWTAELTPEESKVAMQSNMLVGKIPCSMIESIHPSRDKKFLFHKVRLFIDQEHGLPVRFEAYDWPKDKDAAPELVEEYTYLDLRVNTGLKEQDFDPDNAAYSFGRF